MSDSNLISSVKDPNYTLLIEQFFHHLPEKILEYGEYREIFFPEKRFLILNSLFKKMLFELSKNPEFQKKQHDIYKEIFSKTYRV